MPINLKEQPIDLLIPKETQTLQMTFDENINVPDIKPDIERIMLSNGQVVILNDEVDDDVIRLSGEFRVNLLYVPIHDKVPIHNMDIAIPFEEIIRADGMTHRDCFKTESAIEDLTAIIMNSRKVNIKSIIELKVMVSQKKEAMLTKDCESEGDLEKLIKKIDVCQLKDTYKGKYTVRDDVGLPAGRPNILDILWHDITVHNKEAKLTDGKVNIKGSLSLAVLYTAADTGNHTEFSEHDIPFNTIIEMPEARENMTADISLKPGDRNIQVKLDADGEERAFLVEADLNIDIKLYDEAQTDILSDIYSLNKDIIFRRNPINYRKLLSKSQSQVNVKETVMIDAPMGQILQLYYVGGHSVIDSMQVEDERLKLEGALFCKIMYVAADDKMPISIHEAVVPFDHAVDIKGVSDKCQIDISPGIHYMGCAMIGDKEVELKAAVGLNILVFENLKADNITEIDVRQQEGEGNLKMPGIVGYIVKEGESLWDIAKKYRSRIKNIQKINSLEGECIKKGDRLIILKEIGALDEFRYQ